MLVGAGMFVLCSCTSQGSQQKEVVTDSVSVSQVDPVIETIMSRRSIRKYKPEAVEREKMQTIVECGINAPNGMNKQSWEVRVVDNPEFINGLTEIFKKENPKAAERPGFQNLARIPVRVELASEFRYRNPILEENSLVIIISQSGETADSLAALRLAKSQGVPTMAIVNVVGSTIAREADHIFYTLAGPEIAVATTKAYSTQLVAGYLLGVQFAHVRGTITEEKYEELLAALQELPDQIAKLLEDDKERIQWFAAKYANAKDVFFIGRGIDYAVSMEGSLKLKEISYIHSEAYAAGELKHGTISLIEDGILVVSILTQEALYEKMISNMVEVKCRGAYLMGLTTAGNYNIEDTVDFAVYIPKTDEHFTPSLAVVPLQLLGYYVSVSKGLDVDKPRNLAKSVTVE